MKKDLERNQQRLAQLQAKQAEETFLKEEALPAEQEMLQWRLSNPLALGDFETMLARTDPTYEELYDAWCVEARRRREREPKITGQNVYFAGYDVYRQVFEEINELHPWFFPPGIWSPPVLTPEAVASFRKKFERIGRGPLQPKERSAPPAANATASPRLHLKGKQADAEPTPTGGTEGEKAGRKPTE